MSIFLEVFVRLAILWAFITILVGIYSLIWIMMHPRRQFTPPAPRPGPTLPSVEPVRPLFTYRAMPTSLEEWRTKQQIAANPEIGGDYRNISRLDEWRKANAHVK